MPRRDDERSGLLPEIEPDEPSGVAQLPRPGDSGTGPFVPTAGGADLPPPPAFAGTPEAPRPPPAPADPTAELASKLSAVAAGAEPSLVDLAGDEAGEAPPPVVDVAPRDAAPAGPEPAAAPPPPDPDGALELDFAKAGLAPGTRGVAAPGEEPSTPSAPTATPAPPAAAPSPSASSVRRSPDVAAAPEPWWTDLVRDAAARALLAFGLGALLAVPVAHTMASRAGRARLEPLLEELETSAARPLAARAGTLRTLDQIRADLDEASGAVRRRFWLVFGGVALVLGGFGYAALGRIAREG